jgi:uncharacterized protein
MKYLLDVNALVALGFVEHEFYERVNAWVLGLGETGVPELATCSITETGFVRISAQVSRYGLTVSEARSVLLRLKRSRALKFTFIADDHDISQLPDWVSTPKQITDGHLAELARANGAVLATLDRKIPGAFLIPAEK